jgi:polyferredoxin
MLITVIAGPMLFGRLLCGWGCWRAMVLELLPAGRGEGRRKGIWRLLPLAGLAASVAAAAVSVFVLGHRAGGTPARMHGASVASVAVIAATYYFASIGMALALKDRRAFCKYLCPSGAILRLTARKSLARMAARPEVCNDCAACTRACPMDIDVCAIVGAGSRVPGGDCILCQRCAHACPTGALHLEFTIQNRRNVGPSTTKLI